MSTQVTTTPLQHPSSPADPVHWEAALGLSFARRERGTVLVSKTHRGPLQIQKALYPEGPEVCHVTVLHPPGGIAAGDSLEVVAGLETGCRVCLTTPGAAKWYRCPQGMAQQRVRFSVAQGASCEWLPRENILFDGSRVQMTLEVELAAAAQFLGWEIFCFGRRASGEGWSRGGLRLRSDIRQTGRALWNERANVAAGSGFEASSVGLAGYSVTGTLLAAGANIDSDLLAACRSIAPGVADSRTGISAVPNVLLVRYLGHSSQDAFNWFAAVREVVRPALLGLAATAPRVWAC